MDQKGLNEIALQEKIISSSAIEESKLAALAQELARYPQLVNHVEIFTPNQNSSRTIKDSKAKRILLESRARHFESLFIKHGVQREKLTASLTLTKMK